jgi:hypothetical protein
MITNTKSFYLVTMRKRGGGRGEGEGEGGRRGGVGGRE